MGHQTIRNDSNAMTSDLDSCWKERKNLNGFESRAEGFKDFRAREWPLWPIYLNRSFVFFVERTINWNINSFSPSFPRNHLNVKSTIRQISTFIFDVASISLLVNVVYAERKNPKWNIENWDETKTKRNSQFLSRHQYWKFCRRRFIFERHFDFNANTHNDKFRK